MKGALVVTGKFTTLSHCIVTGADVRFIDPPMLDIGVRYSIYVSHVDPKDGPKSFFLQVVSEGWSGRLDKLLDELAESYMTLGSLSFERNYGTSNESKTRRNTN